MIAHWDDYCADAARDIYLRIAAAMRTCLAPSRNNVVLGIANTDLPAVRVAAEREADDAGA